MLITCFLKYEKRTAFAYIQVMYSIMFITKQISTVSFQENITFTTRIV
jgi:hypothetical protein